MNQAKKSAHAAGLAAGAAQPEQRQAQAAAWAADAAAAGAGGGDAAAAAAAASAFAANNKYASSWGILDAGGLSRQGSVNGQQSMSRLPSGAAPLTRQGSGSQRASPRASGTDDGTWQQQQQQRLRGAAGRYAGTSLTPGSVSPRSGTATPAREDSMSGQQSGPAGRRRVAAGAGAGGLSASMRQAEQGTAAGRGTAAAAAGGPRDGSTAGSDDYESAEEQLSSNASPSGGYTGLSGSYGSGAPVTVPSTRGPSSTAAGGSGALPNPPAFLSNRPTSAQAAVATQWSPSKNPAAYAQAPAYMRDAVMRISPEASGTSVGLAPTPQRLQDTAGRAGSMGSRGVSPREGGAVQAGGMRQVGGPLSRPSRVSSSSIGASRVSSASTYEAGGQQGGNSINIYAPLDPPMARSQSGRQSYTQSQFQSQSQQQQQPQVVTAVDLARRQSMARRASSNGLQQGAGDLGGSGGWGSSTGRVSSSSVGYNGQSSNGYGLGAGLAAGRQSQQQQPWGQQGSNMHSAGIYGTIKREQWQQRQQYRL
jgi:hypothetical protein